MEQDGPLDAEGAGERHAAKQRDDGTDWKSIKREFIHGDMSLDCIAEKYGSSRTTIGLRAKAGGWVRLVGTKPLRRGGRKPRRPGLPRLKAAAPVDHNRFIKRLFRLLDNRLTAMEERMAKASAQELGTLEIEREARAASTIAGCYHKIVELEEAARKAGKASETSAVRSEQDADRLRRDLAERLERLIPPRTE